MKSFFSETAESFLTNDGSVHLVPSITNSKVGAINLSTVYMYTCVHKHRDKYTNI